ncbi:VWA domain-containing protein [Methylococcus sp. EFPC2]|uniref:vWA domain-containing protein n=1 Tax=Methylococcus sp. EFPC2 TaxID=2812648 RepID=UPI001967B637|nr:vWA domain-containing protein [Methylococcus sp. EFPC2]QSA96337.1 VWA domain-containing protein [Methylococcus sp. EFPC2]
MLLRIFSLLGSMLAAASAYGQAHQAPPGERNDIRIVIDTSGSMKQTDPHNLRVPALKLLVNLLPQGQTAGVWLFDTQAEPLVPLGIVAADWKQQALASATRIHSKGDYTHIEAALEAAGQGWNTPPSAGEHRHLILLTDGRVDVSKNPQDSESSRERILKNLLPRLQIAGAQVHTIALSNKSDQELMQRIALATGGWSEVAENAEALQRAFVRMFNKAAPPDTVPLKDNRFEIDAGIREFTVLVTLRPGAPATRLVDPMGTEMTGKAVPDTARWVHEAGFDLITVQAPVPGQWKLVADADPANQVMVVTDLQMVVPSVPNVLTQESGLEIHASFSERGLAIKREDFLGLISVDVQLTGPSDSKGYSMTRDPVAAERFVWRASSPLPGEYALSVVANGQTFTRQARQSFRVIASPLKVETRRDGELAVITVTPDALAIKPESVNLKATFTDQAQQSRPVEIHPAESGWKLELPVPKAGEQGVVNFTAEARGADGKPVPIALKPVMLNGEAPRPAEPEAPPATVEPPAWPVVAGLAGAINLVSGLAGYLIYRYLRRRNEAAISALIQKLPL